MIVYSDSQILDLEWIPLVELGEFVICRNIDEYITSTDPLKIAFTTHRLHCDSDAYLTFEDKIIKLSENSKLVFTFESELHNFHWKIWERCHRENVYWVLPGSVNDREDINSHIIFWGDWFKTTTHVYKLLPEKLAALSPDSVKPKYFDAMLGSPKPHRDFIFNAVNGNHLQDKIVMTYGGKWDNNKFFAEDYFIWEPGCVPIGKIIGTADWVDYCGVRTGLSRVIPISVFNDTAYSIVAETDHDNTLSFFSEKTAKPIIARRLFIAFTGYKFLHNLRQQGFKTFDGIIDESYDLEIDSNTRYAMAFKQVKWLCGQDQRTILEKIRPIVEHNFNHIMSTDWTLYAANQIRDITKLAHC